MKVFVELTILLLAFAAATTTTTTRVTARSSKSLDNSIFKTIKAENGDIIDCVDIYKQPAFDHPLLKNHTIQMPKDTSLTSGNGIQQVWQRSGSCPEGTIPILRLGRKKIQNSFVPKLSLDDRAPEVSTVDDSAQEMVVAYSYEGPYRLARGTFDIWNPHVEPKEYSISQVSILGTGSGDYASGTPLPGVKNVASVGWAVFPGFFGDFQTRLFVFWSKDNDNGLGCYNLVCPGFVQINKQIALGAVFENISTGRDGKIFTVSFHIALDEIEEKWYALVNGERVGYWPISIFTNFWDGDGIIWGGSILNTNPEEKPTPTEMGSGHFTNEGSGRSAMVLDALGIRNSEDLQQFSPSTNYVRKRDCYDYRLLPHRDGNPGFDFLYGGPGSRSVTCE